MLGVRDRETAQKAVRNGAYAGYVMAVLVVLGTAFTCWTGLDTNRQQIPADKLAWAIGGASVEAVLVAVLAGPFFT